MGFIGNRIRMNLNFFKYPLIGLISTKKMVLSIMAIVDRYAFNTELGLLPGRYKRLGVERINNKENYGKHHIYYL